MSTALSILDGQTEFSPAQVAVLAHAGVENASREDLAVFFHQSVRTGLDPFAKQIYMIGRNTKNQKTNRWETKYTIQTGIDGYRLIARRAASAARESLGYEDTLWADADGNWHDVWLQPGHPAAAKVTVLRNGQRFSAVALWTEYVQTTREGAPNSMWSRMGANQLAKCAEALALRKAFPQDLSGLYTAEEMGQADNEAAFREAPAPQQPAMSTVARLAAAAATDAPAPVDPATGDDWTEVDWVAELELAGGDIDAIKAIWHRAKRLHADEWVIDAINQAGAEAATATEPLAAELVEEEA